MFHSQGLFLPLTIFKFGVVCFYYQGLVIEIYNSFFVWSASSLDFSWGCLQNISLIVIFRKHRLEHRWAEGRQIYISQRRAQK